MENKIVLTIFIFILFQYSVACLPTSGNVNINSHSGCSNKKQQEKPLIRFNKDKKLKLVNFADLHYGEDPWTDWGPSNDIKSTNVTRNILALERPDFVIFTGDQLTAETMYPNGTEYVHMLVKPLVENNYRWASVYGNHDIGENVTRLEILQAEQKYNLSYTTRMNASLPGVTNYYLPIYSSEENDTTPVMIWWFFDSQGGRTDAGQQPHFIDPLVIQWFKDENSRLKQLWGLLPSLVFFHIPPVEYELIQENIDSNPMCSGLVDDDVTPQEKNTGIMQALTEAGGVQTIFVGHDHGNAWCCFYGEIEVCFNRHTGYGGYGTWVRGARVVSLDLTNLYKRINYIRLETGEIVDEFPKSKKQKGKNI